MTNFHVRHVTAEPLGASWKFNAEQQTIEIDLPMGTVFVEVCSPARPRYGAFPIVRIDACTWKIAPSRYVDRGEDGELRSMPCQISYLLGSDFLVLLDTPAEVGRELMQLGSY